jgi:hypothetical protein
VAGKCCVAFNPGALPQPNMNLIATMHMYKTGVNMSGLTPLSEAFEDVIGLAYEVTRYCREF